MGPSRRVAIGRIIGAAGGVCAAVGWGVLVFAVASLLIEPAGLKKLVLVVAMPMGAMAAVLFVVAVADVVVLARRADTAMPWRVAATHFVMALALLWIGGGGPRAWVGAMSLFGICATQLIAIRLIQMTPSHASSQR